MAATKAKEIIPDVIEDDEEDLSDLTPSERAFLEKPEAPEDEDIIPHEELVPEPVLDDDERPLVVAKTETVEAKAEPGKTEAKTEEVKTEAKAAETPTPIVSRAPLLRETAPADLDQKITAVKGRMTALAKQHDEGDITAVEYEEKRQALADEQADLREQAMESRMAQRINQGQREQDWGGSVEKWFSDHPEFPAKSQLALTAFDQAVRDAETDPANTGLSDRAIIDKAYARYREDFGIGEAKLKDPKAEADAEARRKSATAAAGKVPTTLADVPASDISETGDSRDSEYEALDNMLLKNDIKGYETALDALVERNPKRADAYLRRSE